MVNHVAAWVGVQNICSNRGAIVLVSEYAIAAERSGREGKGNTQQVGIVTLCCGVEVFRLRVRQPCPVCVVDRPWYTQGVICCQSRLCMLQPFTMV